VALFKHFVVSVTTNQFRVTAMRCKLKGRKLLPIAYKTVNLEAVSDEQTVVKAFKNAASKISPDPEDYVVTDIPLNEVVFRRFEVPAILVEQGRGRRKNSEALKLHVANEMGIDPSSFLVHPVSISAAGDKRRVLMVVVKQETISRWVMNMTTGGFPEPDVLDVSLLKWFYVLDWANMDASFILVMIDMDYTMVSIFLNKHLYNLSISLDTNLMATLGALADTFGAGEHDIFSMMQEGRVDEAVLLDVFSSTMLYEISRNVSFLVSSTPEMSAGRLEDIAPVTYIMSPWNNVGDMIIRAFERFGAFPFPNITLKRAPLLYGIPKKVPLEAYALALRGGSDFVKGQPLPA